MKLFLEYFSDDFFSDNFSDEDFFSEVFSDKFLSLSPISTTGLLDDERLFLLSPLLLFSFNSSSIFSEFPFLFRDFLQSSSLIDSLFCFLLASFFASRFSFVSFRILSTSAFSSSPC